MKAALEPIARDPAHGAVLLDFDGTLSHIVARPELATPVPGVRDTLAALAGRYAVVAVVSGRSTKEVRSLVDVPGLRYAGHYGAETGGASLPPSARDEVTVVAERVPGAWVEDKGSSVAVHYRQAPDPPAARESLAEPLRLVAREHGLEAIEGKMVIELVPGDRPRKGSAVLRLARDSGATSVLYAGDDLADLEAFEALDDLQAGGVDTIKVAVRGEETWPELIDAADVVVDGPTALVELLRDLARG